MWWTAGTNRAARHVICVQRGRNRDRRGRWIKRQREQWVTLGTWNFSAGWNKVALSRWTTTGAVVIADAIRVR